MRALVDRDSVAGLWLSVLASEWRNVATGRRCPPRVARMDISSTNVDLTKLVAAGEFICTVLHVPSRPRLTVIVVSMSLIL
jgi:hypothetical protein